MIKTNVVIFIPGQPCSVQIFRKAAFTTTFSCCVPLRRRATRLCTRLKGLHFCVASGVLGYQERKFSEEGLKQRKWASGWKISLWQKNFCN